MVFNFLKNKAQDRVNRASGNTDYLEAVCAAVALISAADGEIEDEEIQAATAAISANQRLLDAFTGRQIEDAMETMFNRTKGANGRISRVGLSNLWREIEEVAKERDQAEVVLLTALDVSDADGEREPAEQAVLEKMARILNLDLAKLGG